jgi:hypothetical protein
MAIKPWIRIRNRIRILVDLKAGSVSGSLFKLVAIHNTGTYSNQDLFSNLSVLVSGYILKQILKSYFFFELSVLTRCRNLFHVPYGNYFGHVCIVHSGAVRFINSLVFFRKKSRYVPVIKYGTIYQAQRGATAMYIFKVKYSSISIFRVHYTVWQYIVTSYGI